MRFSDEILMAFADGELPEDEAAEVAAALADDRSLAARVERFRAVRRALKSTYDSVAEEPIPERFRALLGDLASSEPITPAPRAAPAASAHAPEPDTASVLDFRIVRPSPAEKVARQFGAPVWAALAASVLVGVLAGRLLIPGPQSLLAADNGQLRAGAALTRVLDTRLASASDNSTAELHVGVSFRANEGQYCRTFDSIEQQRAVSGLACRDDNGWVVRVATTEPAVSSDYRQAGSASPAVMSMVDQMMAGEPLTDAEEQAARARNWRR